MHSPERLHCHGRGLISPSKSQGVKQGRLDTDFGLFGPDASTWRVHANPSMAIAGAGALLQPELHPIAMAGVAANSNFHEDARGRLARTAEYVGILTYGTTSEAQMASQHVRAVHKKLKWDDPHLLR